MHLNVVLSGSEPDVEWFRDMARTAERGLFDSVSVPDRLAVTDGPVPGTESGIAPDPLTVLAALAGATERIGLVAGASTTFGEPFHLARSLATLDHLSGGRAGWEMATSGGPAEAANFNLDEPVESAVRYERAAEFLDVASQLWDSWADDAHRVRPVEHTGLFFKVRGPLTVRRAPQGWPVLALSAVSETGREFAARYAELLFTAQDTLEDAIAFAADVKSRATSYGRAGDLPRILPGICPVLGTSPAALRAARSAAEASPGHRVLAGTPEQIAADLELWYRTGAADGFSILPSHPAALAAFVIEVVPLLQRRGLFRTAYQGTTLRQHLGLPRPVDHFPERALARV